MESSMKIVTLDGGSGAGKSTQTRLLLEHYNELNIEQIEGRFWTIRDVTKRLFNLAEFKYLSDRYDRTATGSVCSIV